MLCDSVVEWEPLVYLDSPICAGGSQSEAGAVEGEDRFSGVPQDLLGLGLHGGTVVLTLH